MYEDDNRRSHSLRNFLLGLLLVIIFVLLLVWLLPKVLKFPNYDGLNNRIFNSNVNEMKDASINYFTKERLPQKEGDSVTLTLQEMLDKKLLLPFKDKNGNTCDTKASYVTLTKVANEYELKVNLKCGEEEDYIIVHLGCYSYCNRAICEVKEEPKEKTSKSKSSYTTTGGVSCSLEISSGKKGNNGWYLGDVTVSFKSKKTTNSGAKITEYGIGTSKNYNKNNSYVVKNDGSTSVYGYVKDSKGKTAVCKIVVKKDTTKPNCSLAVISGTKNSSNNYITDVKVGFNSKTDKASGIAQYGVTLSTKPEYKGNSIYVVSKNGTTKVYGYVKDKAGNTNVCSLEVTKEKPKDDKYSVPSCELSVTKGTLGDNGWYRSDVTVGFKSKKTTNGATITGYGIGTTVNYNGGTSYLVKDDGLKTVYGYVKDSKGNTSVCRITVKKDATKPSCGLEVQSGTNDGTGYITDAVVGFKSKLDATSGMAAFGIGKSLTYANNATYKVTTLGDNTIYGYVKDKAGNTNVCSIKVKRVEDKKSTPSCSLQVTSGTLGDNGWYRSNVVVGFKSKTTTNGATITGYGLGTTTNYDKATSYTLTADGTKTIYGYVKDSKGNTAVCKIDLKKDATKPACGLEVQSGSRNNEGYITDAVVGFKSKSDATSGMAAFGIGKSLTYANNTTYKVTTLGDNTIYGYVKDKAGNTNVCSIKVKRVEDKKSTPSCSLQVTSGTLGDNGWYRSNVVVGFKSKTTTNGATITGYGLGTTTNYDKATSYTLTADGTKTIYGYVKDSKGNTAVCSIGVKKDATKPTCSLQVTSGTMNDGSYVTDVTVGFKSKSDATSGMAAFGIGKTLTYANNTSFKVTANGNHTVNGYVKDKAGNTNICSISFTKKDLVYEYEYKKSWSDEYSDWSAWTTSTYDPSKPPKFGVTDTKVTEDLGSKKVEDGYTYKTGAAIYGKKTREVASITEKVCSGYKYYRSSTTSTTVYAISTADDWKYVKTITQNYVPESTLSVKYEFAGFNWSSCNNACSSTPNMLFRVYTRNVSKVNSKGDSITKPNGVTVKCSSYETKTSYVYGTYTTVIGYEETREIKYKTIYQYRYKTRTLIRKAGTSIKWSLSPNDTALINDGYKYTGNKKVKS